MIVITRPIFRFFSYTTVFFPHLDEVEAVAEQTGPFDLSRVFWCDSDAPFRRGLIQRQRTATVCIDLQVDADTLWQGISKNGRNEIRSAQRLGHRVRIERDGPASTRDFLSIYQTFAVAKEGVSRLNADILSRYSPYSDLFVVYLDDRPVCGHVYLRDSALGRARLLYSASRRLEDRESARLCGHLNRLLHWHVIHTYREEHLRVYDFGGIREDETDGIARFKTSFGGDIRQEFIFLFCKSPHLAALARWVRPSHRRFLRSIQASAFAKAA